MNLLNFTSRLYSIRYESESSINRLKELFETFGYINELVKTGKRKNKKKGLKIFIKKIAFKYSEKEIYLAYFKFNVFPEFLKVLDYKRVINRRYEMNERKL